MFRKNYYLFILTVALVLSCSLATFAQTQELSGRIEMKKADGTTTPFAGAVVEVFRIDKKGSFPAVKSDENGNFTVTGIPDEGEYVVSISGQKINPELSLPVKPGAKGIYFTVSPGEGRRLTEAEVKVVLAKAEELTPEERKKREELEAKNRNVAATNAAIDKAIQEGVKAFEAKNYDLAIVKFEEGYQASPEYIGSAPGMLNNKAASLVRRALVSYNTMVKDPAQKAELAPKVVKDFEDAIEAYNMSWNILKGGKPEEIAKIQKGYDANKSQVLVGVQDAVNLMVRTGAISEAKKDTVINLIHEYVAFEKDQKKKEAAQIDLASYLQKANDFDSAIVEFRKAAEMSPNNPDVIGGLGLALYTVAYESEGTAKKQEALNYLQHYLDIAPKDHPLRDGIEGGVADLKSQKLKPQKITAKN